MNAKELAAILNGRTEGSEISEEEQRQAKQAGLVVAFGASDDCLEFRGAFDDEISSYNGVTVQVTADGIVEKWSSLLKRQPHKDVVREYLKRDETAKTVTAKWDQVDAYEWFIEGDFPFEPFDVAHRVEGAAPFCRGIVFSVEDLK